MLAASLAAGLGSFALGETDLLRVAIVIVIVCVLTWLCALLLRARMRTSYRPDPSEASVDSIVRVRVDTRITRPMMPAAVVCHTVTGPGLSSTNHLAVPGDRARHGVRLDFTTTVQQRGVHTLGPLEATVRDPLGLVSTRYLGTQSTQILGLPRRHDVHPSWLHAMGSSPLSSDSTLDEGRDGEPDVGVREHRPEDGLRRIHWRTSARTGRLMTRLDHPQSHRTAVVAFESRQSMHRASTFENTLEIVASLGIALLHRGWDLRLVDSAGEHRAPGGGWEEPSLLRFLALAETIEGGTAPPIPADRALPLMVTTDHQQHRPGLMARTIVVPLPGTHARLPAEVDALASGLSVADLLGAPPRTSVTA